MSALMLTAKLIEVSRMPAGARGVVRLLAGGHQFRSRLANLGFTAGAVIEVRQNHGRGPVLVALRGTLIALGRAEADKVLVQAGAQA